ncbi:Protein CURVATURE THYLAKOID 1D, chloroplastic [Linum perenne]
MWLILIIVHLQFDSEDTVSLVIYGSGALLAIWLLSAVVNAVDSIPLFPKLMEVVGLGYSAWFTTRYLLFKVRKSSVSIVFR